MIFFSPEMMSEIGQKEGDVTCYLFYFVLFVFKSLMEGLLIKFYELIKSGKSSVTGNIENYRQITSAFHNRKRININVR